MEDATVCIRWTNPMDEQFLEYLGSFFSDEPLVLSEFDEKAFEAYEERQEAFSLFLAGY